MKALVYHGPGQHSWEEHADPVLIAETDAIVRIDAVTICGTDLHILAGDVPEVEPGRILGHEAVGTVESVGSSVHRVAVGDKVLVSCINGCGTCDYCRTGAYGQCRRGGGWVLGHTIDGVQAEYARVPFADNSLYPLPAGVSDESALLLADIFPTAYEVGVLNGRVRPGDTVAVVGCGPIGLAAIATAQLLSPSAIIAIDRVPSRLDMAKLAGATMTVDGADDDLVSKVMDATDGLGADAVIEAVGTPTTFEMCTTLVRPGGHIANVGVHGSPATLHLENLWSRNVTITTGLVDTYTTPRLMRMLASGQLSTAGFVTHRLGIGEMMDAYDIFGRAGESGAIKVALFRH